MTQPLVPIKRALLSVSDKTGLDVLAKSLYQNGVEIISSGGTGRFLQERGIPFIPIEQVTGNPEAFAGRMKTLSFQVSSALLFRRDSDEDQKQAQDLNIRPIDLIVCNLYPFQEAALNKASLDELVENIDIGGPTMIRAAAKNFNHVMVCTEPAQYREFLDHFEESKGQTSRELREAFALEAFRHTAAYDGMIATVLEQRWHAAKPSFSLPAQKSTELRYGENPHQKAWVYPDALNHGLAHIMPLQGKPMSYNNLLDADAAWRSCNDIAASAKAGEAIVSIIKHTNPCGLAMAKNPTEALKLAWAGDPISSFGSIICCNQEVDEDFADWLSSRFVEVVIAPSFSSKALEIFSTKKNLRLVPYAMSKEKPSYAVRSISGGWLVQEEDIGKDLEFQNMTKREFGSNLKELAQFGTTAGKHLKSNAIVLVRKTEEGVSIIGAGMGNPNRLVSLEQAVQKAKENGVDDLSDVLMISDAFFPFADSIEVAHKFGIQNIVQPGGSIKDKEVIAACDELNISMVFTGRRHFRH